jgi:GNAT superfamily N-acetyltransferase
VNGEALLEAAAENLAGWHDCSVRALGFATHQGRWWWTSPSPGPWIYFTAICTRMPRDRRDHHEALAALATHLEDPAGSFEAVCDSFGRFDLAPLGLSARMPGLWYARPPGPPPRHDQPPGLEVSEVTGADDLAEFERATCLAFAAPSPLTRFEVHAPGILEDPAMHVFVGRVGGEVVSGAMAFVGSGVVGIYGVGTVPGHRRQGYARALTGACLALAPMVPATLQPSAAASAMYRSMGFTEIGAYAHWS